MPGHATAARSSRIFPVATTTALSRTYARTAERPPWPSSRRFGAGPRGMLRFSNGAGLPKGRFPAQFPGVPTLSAMLTISNTLCPSSTWMGNSSALAPATPRCATAGLPSRAGSRIYSRDTAGQASRATPRTRWLNSYNMANSQVGLDGTVVVGSGWKDMGGPPGARRPPASCAGRPQPRRLHCHRAHPAHRCRTRSPFRPSLTPAAMSSPASPCAPIT